MLYRALTRGFANGRVIEPDEQFDWEGPQGTWMDLVETAEVEPPTTTAAAPSTNLDLKQDATLEDLLGFTIDAAAIAPDEFTETGFLRKSAFEKRLERPVPQNVFMAYIKHVKEQRAAAN